MLVETRSEPNSLGRLDPHARFVCEVGLSRGEAADGWRRSEKVEEGGMVGDEGFGVCRPDGVGLVRGELGVDYGVVRGMTGVWKG